VPIFKPPYQPGWDYFSLLQAIRSSNPLCTLTLTATNDLTLPLPQMSRKVESRKSTSSKRKPKKKPLKRSRSSTVSLIGRKPLRTIREAEKIMNDTFRPYAAPGWTITFAEYTFHRAGSCSFHTKTLRISKSFAILVAEADLVDIILHEIAHMKAGERVKHGPAWRKIAKEIGCSGSVTHNFVWEEAAFVAKCPADHHQKAVNQIKWKEPLSCSRCKKWLLYFCPESGELVEFGGSSDLTKYHREYEKSRVL
jgi:SprT protein